jgi:flavodoxin
VVSLCERLTWGAILNTLIICKSIHHENTLRVAEVMADELDAEILSPEKIDIEDITDYDLIGFGSGIYMGKHHRSLLNLVSNLDVISGKDVFVFYTSGFSRFPALPSFETALVERLEKTGAKVIDTFSCRGLETYGPFRIGGGKNKGHPDENDLDQARFFAKSLVRF